MVAADVAWMLIATALVLLMTPGVAFFYGGMVPLKSVVSTKLQSFASMGFVTLIWAIIGYSLVFSPDAGGGLIGGLDYFMLSGVGMEPNPSFGATIPHVLFMLFQATFAIVTPALITGAVAERVRFKAWLVIMCLWSLLVYAPVAHWVWGPDGWILKLGGIDFAGGMVVHMTSGYAALMAAVMLGNRKKFRPDEQSNFSTLMVLLGGALLWFGWIGFNAGSALAANGLAAQAAGTSVLAAAAAMSTWMLCDWSVHGRPTAIGAAVGAVAGLVAITPAAGFVSLQSAMLIGGITAIICHYASRLVKQKLKTDDTVDVFACHGVGGTVGSILTAVFASSAVNPAIPDGLLSGDTKLIFANMIGAAAVVVYTMVMTYIVFKLVGFIMPVRVSEDEEKSGLDATQHGEKAFVLR